VQRAILAVPIGVRNAEAMTASGMSGLHFEPD
jgi:hypothetical protein